MLSSLDYIDTINYNFLDIRGESQENIYACLDEPPLLTVIMGAKCSDGVVLVADRKLTNIFGGKPEFREKIFGDLAHFPMGYTGLEEIFHVFRKSVIGEWFLKLKDSPLSMEDVIPTYASVIRIINGISSKPRLKVLMGKHLYKNTELYHIHSNGKYEITTYSAIGSGQETANRYIYSQSLQFDKISMKEFAKHAYFAITYMDQYCPDLGVGVNPNGDPQIRYLGYDDEWDRGATPEDIIEFKTFTNQRLEHFKEAFESPS